MICNIRINNIHTISLISSGIPFQVILTISSVPYSYFYTGYITQFINPCHTDGKCTGRIIFILDGKFLFFYRHAASSRLCTTGCCNNRCSGTLCSDHSVGNRCHRFIAATPCNGGIICCIQRVIGNNQVHQSTRL